MDRKALTEADIRTKFITPAIAAKWDVMTQMLEERYFTAGRVIVRGKITARGAAKKADYILFYKPNIPLAIVEAKDNNHAVGDGMQQALDYAEILDVPFAYSSNGDGFLEHDRLATHGVVERELSLDDFPTPEELWRRAESGIRSVESLDILKVDPLSDSGPPSRSSASSAARKPTSPPSASSNPPSTTKSPDTGQREP
jgi:type I restriction enzyme, R subunit